MEQGWGRLRIDPLLKKCVPASSLYNSHSATSVSLVQIITDDLCRLPTKISSGCAADFGVTTGLWEGAGEGLAVADFSGLPGLQGTLVRCLKCLVTLKRQYCSSAHVSMSSLTIPSSFPKVMNAVGGKTVTALAWGIRQVAYCTVVGVAMHSGSL